MPEWILILTVGLPRSGKSTWARAQGCPIVNRDAIRLALHGQAFVAQAEDMVTAIEGYMVRSLFEAGHNKVVVDATHLKEKYRKRWEYGPWTVKLEKFDVPAATCIERAKLDGREDLIPIIERMAENVENYSKGWFDGTIYDHPMVIFTARDNIAEIHEWLIKERIEVDSVTNKKPIATAYIDDRGIRFTNWKDMLNYF